mmetsp:Transcript_128594/g.372124  ORF Transcript_128594/g.372124 Transcript_128594/m.372124 type:complete len:228 (-) Transcript_128594:1648-2331(-)
MWMFLGASTRRASVKAWLVMRTNSGGSSRRMHNCNAVSPSQFLAFRSTLPLSTNTRTASSEPRTAAYIRGVHPRLSQVLGSASRSSKQLSARSSSSVAAQCAAEKPSRSLEVKLAPTSTNDGNNCQWPSRVATMRGVAPLWSTALMSTGGRMRSLFLPSRLTRIKFTRSKCPEAQAWCRTPRPILSTAPASQYGPLPLPRSETKATKQARCPLCAARCNGVSWCKFS